VFPDDATEITVIPYTFTATCNITAHVISSSPGWP